MQPLHPLSCLLHVLSAPMGRYAKGVVPPLPRRAVKEPGTKAGQGGQGAWGCPSPGPLPPRRAGDQARGPGSGRPSDGWLSRYGSPLIPGRGCHMALSLLSRTGGHKKGAPAGTDAP